ncbi:hypothetical protein P4S73_29360 [Paraglaciecola sp. Hal342]
MYAIIADLYNTCCNQKTADYYGEPHRTFNRKIKEAQTLVLSENAWFAIEFGSAQGRI